MKGSNQININKPLSSYYYNLDILNTIKDEIIYGGYMAALGSPCLIISTCLILSIPINLPILLISYLLPLIVYSYDYYRDIDKDIQNNSERAIFLKKKAKNYPYLFSFYIILLISLLVLFANIDLVLFIIAIITGGFVYNIIFKELTKKIPAFKNIFTATTWALGGAFFPLLYNSLEMNISFLIIFSVIFLRCIINVIFFDFKDMDNDKINGLKTLPVIFGKETTINLLKVINLISFIPLILGIYFNIINITGIFLLVFLFFGYFYIRKAKLNSSNELESSAHKLADSEFILWALLLSVISLV